MVSWWGRLQWLLGPRVLRNVCLCVCFVWGYVCMCVWERETDRQKDRGRETERSDSLTASRYQARQVDHECLWAMYMATLWSRRQEICVPGLRGSQPPILHVRQQAPLTSGHPGDLNDNTTAYIPIWTIPSCKSSPSEAPVLESLQVALFLH